MFRSDLYYRDTRMHVGFEVLTAMNVKFTFFRNVMPYILVEGYRRFGGTSSLQLLALSCKYV
jgi:hypothetical protein